MRRERYGASHPIIGWKQNWQTKTKQIFVYHQFLFSKIPLHSPCIMFYCDIGREAEWLTRNKCTLTLLVLKPLSLHFAISSFCVIGVNMVLRGDMSSFSLTWLNYRIIFTSVCSLYQVDLFARQFSDKELSFWVKIVINKYRKLDKITYYLQQKNI